MKSRIGTGLLVLVLLTPLTGCGSKGDATREDRGAAGKLVLGASISLTGSLAQEGTLTKEGYDVCATVVNDKGGVSVGGAKLRLEIQYQDDTSKPDTAAQLVDQFNDKGVKLILGPYGSATTEAAAAVVERNKQVMADSSGADDKIFAKGYTRTFAVLSPASVYAASMVEAIAELADPKPKTLAFVSADDGFSKSVTEAGVAKAKALGFTVLEPQYVPNGTSDVSAALNKIKGQRPDVIVGSVHLKEGVAIVHQSKELGVKPSGFAETVAPPTPDFARTLGADAEGVLGSTQWTPRTKGTDRWIGSAADYVTAFGKQFGGRVPEYHGAEATAACLAFVLAAEKAGSVDPGKIRDQLAALDEQTFFGSLKFNDKGQNVSKPMSVIQIQGGKPVAVWPKTDAEAALKWPAGT